MQQLPSRAHNPEIAQNFEFLEAILSVNIISDVVVASEVGGTKARKLKIVDLNGKLIGYVPLYTA